jgi:hypothetical protein
MKSKWTETNGNIYTTLLMLSTPSPKREAEGRGLVSFAHDWCQSTTGELSRGWLDIVVNSNSTLARLSLKFNWPCDSYWQTTSMQADWSIWLGTASSAECRTGQALEAKHEGFGDGVIGLVCRLEGTEHSVNRKLSKRHTFIYNEIIRPSGQEKMCAIHTSL